MTATLHEQPADLDRQRFGWIVKHVREMTALYHQIGVMHRCAGLMYQYGMADLVIEVMEHAERRGR